MQSISTNFAASMKTKAGKEQFLEKVKQLVGQLDNSLSTQQQVLADKRRLKEQLASEHQSLVRPAPPHLPACSLACLLLLHIFTRQRP